MIGHTSANQNSTSRMRRLRTLRRQVGRETGARQAYGSGRSHQYWAPMPQVGRGLLFRWLFPFLTFFFGTFPLEETCRSSLPFCFLLRSRLSRKKKNSRRLFLCVSSLLFLNVRLYGSVPTHTYERTHSTLPDISLMRPV